MERILFEIVVIFTLILANGAFAMSEIAVVSSRKSLLQKWSDDGDKRAAAALELANSPSRFLATVQVGITLIGVCAGALGGATLSEEIASLLAGITVIAPYKDGIALGIVVLAISYCSLILGELAPKRLALANPESIASVMARPMQILSKVTSPAIRVISASTDGIIRLLGAPTSVDHKITPEEISMLLEQGARSGIIEGLERDMMESVLRLDERRVSSMMTPRTEVIWFDIGDSRETVARKVVGAAFSHFPVGEGGVDNILGLIRSRDLLRRFLLEEPFNLRECIVPALFVPETISALDLLERMKATHNSVALIVNEYGGFEGIISIADLTKSVLGNVALSEEQQLEALNRQDGSWLMDGGISIDRLKELLLLGPLPEESEGAYNTLAGFALVQFGGIPKAGDTFEFEGWRFEVVDMDNRRIDKVLISKLPEEAAQTEEV